MSNKQTEASEDLYYMIDMSEDGDVYVTEHTPDDLVKMLNEEVSDTGKLNPFLPSLPGQNVMTWKSQTGASRLLIKGHIALPKPVQVVTAYEVE